MLTFPLSHLFFQFPHHGNWHQDPQVLMLKSGVPSDSLSHPTSNLLGSPVGFTFKMWLEPTSLPCFYDSPLTQAPQSFQMVPAFCFGPDSHFSMDPKLDHAAPYTELPRAPLTWGRSPAPQALYPGVS